MGLSIQLQDAVKAPFWQPMLPSGKQNGQRQHDFDIVDLQKELVIRVRRILKRPSRRLMSARSLKAGR